MTRRGQVAIEFLLTYGWAFLIIIAAIATLSYMGVFNPDAFLPRQCIIGDGISCVDYHVTTGAVTVALRNGRDETLTLSNITADGCTGSANGTLGTTDTSLFKVTGCSHAAGSRYRGTIRLNYTGDSGLAHVLAGSIVDRVE